MDRKNYRNVVKNLAFSNRFTDTQHGLDIQIFRDRNIYKLKAKLTKAHMAVGQCTFAQILHTIAK